MQLSLRRVQAADMEQLYLWANDPVTRQNAFHTERISRKTHREWFENVLRDESVVIYICMEGSVPVAQIRFQIAEGEALISYSVDVHRRGQGVGTRLLGLAENRLEKEYPGIRRLRGEVKYTNTPSIRAFEKNGYSRENGKDYIVFTKRGSESPARGEGDTV